MAGRQLDRERAAVKEFEVRAAAYERDLELGAAYLVLAEDDDGGGRRLEIQRSLAPDEQDRALGMDTYCLLDESGATHYGGIGAWRLGGGRLEIELTPSATSVLGTDGYRLTLPTAAGVPETVGKGLAALLTD